MFKGMGSEASLSAFESCGAKTLAPSVCLKATNIMNFAHKSGMWVELGEGGPSLLGERQAGAEQEWGLSPMSGRYY